MFAAYAAMYDVAAKTNVVPQYINSYFYPKLCLLQGNDDNGYGVAVQRLLRVALLNFIGLTLAALVTSISADALFGLYFGGRYAKFGYILPLLLFVAATYSFAFYGQTLLRADGRFDALAKVFNITAFSGILLGAILYYLWGINGAMLAIILLKSPGVGIMLYLYRNNYPRRIFLCIYVFVFVSMAAASYLAYRNIFSTLVVVASMVAVCGFVRRSLWRDCDSKIGVFA